MRAKILFLTTHSEYRQSLRFIQQALSELAIAFSHSFVMREMSLKEDLSDGDLLQAIKEHDAVMLAGTVDGEKRIARLINCHSKYSMLNQLDALDSLSRLKASHLPKADLVWPMDETTPINKTAVTACALSKKQGKPLVLLETDATRAWSEPLNRAVMYAALPTPEVRALEELIQGLLHASQYTPLVLCAKSEARLLTYLLLYIGGTEQLAFEEMLSDTLAVQYVQPQAQKKEVPLFAGLYATVKLVRDSLKLEREADCLETVVTNVLQSGWRTPEFGIGEKTISSDEVLELMTQQIQLAGELFERLG